MFLAGLISMFTHAGAQIAVNAAKVYNEGVQLLWAPFHKLSMITVAIRLGGRGDSDF